MSPRILDHRRRDNSRRYQAGFTLIEILIVLAIIALVWSIGIPALNTVTNQRINSTTRRFIGLLHTIRNDAILLNLVHRLVINLEDQTWWIEQQRTFGLIEEQQTLDPKKGEVDSNFIYASKYTKEPIKMPGGVVFSGVRTERDGLIRKGVVYIHIFPNGFTEQSILYFSREGSENVFYSLLIKPSSGKVELAPGTVETFQ